MSLYYVGVDVGGTNLVAGLVDENAQILYKAGCPVDRSMTGAELAHEIALLAHRVVEETAVPPDEVGAVGVGIPGQVDHERGLVTRTTNMPLGNTPLRDIFQRQWDVPVYLGNDANCAAVAEYEAGAAKNCDPAVVVTLGTGIGGGLISGGKLFTGFAGSGMEVGHIPIHPEGAACPCGNCGCWERYGSASALIALTGREMDRNRKSLLWASCGGDKGKITGRTAFEAAGQGDESARRVLAEYRRNLSYGLITVIDLLQPEIICLGGGVSNAPDELLLDPLRELVARGVYDKSAPVRLEHAALGNDAGVVGAALLCKVL